MKTEKKTFYFLSKNSLSLTLSLSLSLLHEKNKTGLRKTLSDLISAMCFVVVVVCKLAVAFLSDFSFLSLSPPPQAGIFFSKQEK